VINYSQDTTKQPHKETYTHNQPYQLAGILNCTNTTERQAGKGRQSTLPVTVAVTVELRQCACGCGKRFPAINPARRYIDRNHKQRAYKARKQPKTERYCVHCGSHDMPKRRDAKYCNSTCRTMAYRHRRSATIPALITLGAKDREFARDVLDRAGLSEVTKVLHKAGLHYDYKRNRWV